MSQIVQMKKIFNLSTCGKESEHKQVFHRNFLRTYIKGEIPYDPYMTYFDLAIFLITIFVFVS